MTGEQPGNGRIEMHTYQITDIIQRLDRLDAKLDDALQIIPVLRVRVEALENWVSKATAIGTALILTLFGVILKLVLG
jgi:hypothetical protein